MTFFNPPKTLPAALDEIIQELPLNDRVFIARLQPGQIFLIKLTLGAHIRDALGFARGNPLLIDACRRETGRPELSADEAFDYVILKLWQTLRQTHRLRALERPIQQ